MLRARFFVRLVFPSLKVQFLMERSDLSPLTGTDAAEREQRAKFVCTMPSRKEEDEGQGVRGWVTHKVACH